ncbi:MAG TPA: hypothetical protein VHB79_21065 [Polyangiaceae bacterium]|nr:hypothetical protein [Polyangiaceae bacterium]
MTIRCSSSESFLGAAPRFVRWGLGLAIVATPALAKAQAAPALPPEPAPVTDDAPEQPVTPAPARAPEPSPDPLPPPEPATPISADAADGDEPSERHGKTKGDKTGKPKRDKTDKKKHKLKLKARVFVLAELSHRRETVVGTGALLVTRDRDALDLSLQRARVAAEYRSPIPWLSAELELELANKVRVKDAYLQAGDHLYAKAGQFKVPAPALELASPWRVPLVRRGFVHDLLTDWMDVGKRRPGLALGYRDKGSLKPRLTVGIFQGTTLKQVVPGDRDTELIDHASLEAQTFAARGEVTVFGVALGAWYEQRVGSRAVGQFEHYATFGLDATTDLRFGPGELRLWLDGMGGQSFYVAGTEKVSDPKPWFAAARALVAYRFGGAAQGEPYVETFGFFAALDPDAHITSDAATEAAVGIAGGLWYRARITLQAETTHARRNFPRDLLDYQEPDHKSLLLQAGARF